MIPIKTSKEIEIMKKGGKISARVLNEVLAAAKPGVSTLELNNLAEKLILEAGGKPSFKGFKSYPFATCINVNEGIVHGLPSAKGGLKEGDLVTVDLGILYKGLHTDNARTVKIQSSRQKGGQAPFKVQSSIDKFLETGQKALENAIKQCQVGKTVGDISHTIQTTVEKAGYNVARELGGHGVGRKLHEPPFIPGLGQPRTGPILKAGVTLAIEVIYARGSGKIEVLNDGWTVVAVDGDVAGLFEHTVAVTQSGPIILTSFDSLLE